jgi:DNA polymerase-1
MVNEKTQRVHTSYHQAVTATGRLSSTDPNLQNIPIRSEEGRRIREAFIAAEGYKIVAADYSQIELRIMAHLSQDKGLLNAFANGLDVHSATAAEVFGVELDDVTTDMRRKAKAVNFGLIYGMSAFGLARQLDVLVFEAEEFLNSYFAKFPEIKVYMDQTIKFCRKNGYVNNIFGRRSHFTSINDKNYNVRNFQERAAINAPIQGSASEIMRLAMIRLDKRLNEKKNQKIKMLLQIHDELIFEVPKIEVKRISKIIIEEMSGVVDSDQHSFSIPLTVDLNSGDNWGTLH